MSTCFKLYENIDKIDPTELKRAAGIKDPEKVVWPKGKKYKVQLGGKECSVTTSFARLEERIYGNLDAYSALSTMLSREEVVERMWKEDPNGHTDAVNYAYAEFLPGLPTLSYEEIEHRKAFTAAVLTLISDQKTIETIAECAPRKKNGLFHKGRVFKIGLTGLAEKYSSELIEIVGKSKDETKLTISVLGRNTSPDEIEAWNQDFISTYHAGLPISEALKTVFKAIDPGLAFVDATEKDDAVEQKKEKPAAKPAMKSEDNGDSGQAERIVSLIQTVDTIDFDGKAFVFDRLDYVPINGIYHGPDSPEHPIIKKVIEAGGCMRKNVTGKTDYLVLDDQSEYIGKGAKCRDALIQLDKGKNITIITLSNLLNILK